MNILTHAQLDELDRLHRAACAAKRAYDIGTQYSRALSYERMEREYEESAERAEQRAIDAGRELATEQFYELERRKVEHLVALKRAEASLVAMYGRRV